MDRIKTYIQAVPKRYYRIAAWVLAIMVLLFGLAISIVLNKREALLASAIDKAKMYAKRTYALDLQIERAYFSGLRSVTFERIAAIPADRDTLMSVKSLEVSVKMLPLLAGNIKLSRVQLADASVRFIKRDSVSNYDFLFREKKADTTQKTSPSSIDLAQVANRMLNNVLYKIPDNMRVRHFEVLYEDDSLRYQMVVPHADIDHGELISVIQVNNTKTVWHLTGDLHPGKKELFFRLAAEGKKVEMPLLEKKYGLTISFDTIETHLKSVRWKNEGALNMSGSWRVSNLLVNHWRIASNDVIVPHAYMDAEVVIGEDYISLDKESTVQLGNIVLHPYARLGLRPHKTYALGLDMPKAPAQAVFDAFPQGLFTSLEHMRVSGKLGYQLGFFLDETMPDSVQLSSHMLEEQFTILKWGSTNLSKINHSFIYTPMEDGRPVRNIIVGPENPDYTPLHQISADLRNAVLTAEDPSFFSHEGFVPKAIRASIATNFKEKAFKRGGSTLSMQLVKNVYLDREKTLARKIEEMLIVWIMEHKHIVSKERMFEVYLNIIEWGRNIYGIGEASRYYFLKQPADLDLGESIFLASIVPRPKSGMYRFDSNGILKDYLRGYYRLIGGLMAQRGLVPYDSTRTYGFYSVTLRDAVRPQPSEIDSTGSPIIDFERELEDAKRILEELFGKEPEEQ